MSRMTMVVWLFVALVVTTSYTASLTSRLTVQQLNNHKVDINELVTKRDKVGCSANSFVKDYLKVLGFREEDILRVHRADEYPQLLRNGTIKAAFLVKPYVKIFLAKYCNGFASAEPTYKSGGFGFAFAKGHPLLPDISEAVVNLSESGELKHLENKMLSKYNCSESQIKNEGDQAQPLDVQNFSGLFLITFATSTGSLLYFCVSNLSQNWPWNFIRVAPEPHVAAADHDPHKDEINMFACEMETYQGWR